MFSRKGFVRSAVIAVFGMVCVSALAASSHEEYARVEYVPANSNPPIPPGLKVTCLQDPNTLTPSKTCPVVKYQGITTWAYSYIDNRVSLALVGYDGNNNIVSNVEKPGARYVFNVTSSIANKNVLFFGQGEQHVTATWSELGAKPEIATVAANSAPTPPAGLKVTCMVNGSSLQPSATCPVVKLMGYTTWAFSYIDNRVSLAFVTYGPDNKVVRNVEKTGTRYVWVMASNASDQTITATGQGNSTVSLPWSQVGP